MTTELESGIPQLLSSMPEGGSMGETALPALSLLHIARNRAWTHVASSTHMYKLHSHCLLTAFFCLPFRPRMYMIGCVPPLGEWTHRRILAFWVRNLKVLGVQSGKSKCRKFPWPHGLLTPLEVGEGRVRRPRRSRVRPRARPLLPSSEDEARSRCPSS